MYARILKDDPKKNLTAGDVYHIETYVDAPETVTLMTRVHDGQPSGAEVPESAVELSTKRGPSFWAAAAPERISPALQGKALRMGMSMQEAGIGYICMPVANEYEAEQRLREAADRLEEMAPAADAAGTNMETHEEIIKCPNCGSVEAAEVEHKEPFHSYTHTCRCGYVITESDWDRVENEVAAIAETK